MKFLDRVDSIARRIERFVSGSAPSDPLYVSNRTFGQKIRVVVLIGAPVLALAVLLGLALGSYFDTPPAQQASGSKEPTGEITAKVLPHLEKNYKSESDKDVDVTEAFVGRGSDHSISGKLRNNTDHVVHVADVIFDVTDEEGSALGAVAVRVENIAARATVPFRKTIDQQTARSALVREVHTR